MSLIDATVAIAFMAVMLCIFLVFVALLSKDR